MNQTVRIAAFSLVTASILSAAAAAEEVDFLRHIAPILQTHCVKCHGPTKQKGALRFDAKSGTLREGDSGLQAVVPLMPDESEMLRRISSRDDAERMPPEGDRLSDAKIELVRRWIAGGAKWPQEDSAPAATELIVTDEDRRHWSFLPLSSPAIAEVKSAGDARSPIDRFVVAALERRGLSMSAPAPPEKLVRRIYFDLIGLPPTPQEVADFTTAAATDRDAAIAALVDRLLASEHYGERWARHWLDVVRYADSNGQEGDQDRPYAYQYRDFVIQALNSDLPFDTFVRWQIAGDELEPENPLAIAATGFWVAGPHTVLMVPMEEEKTRNRYNELDDMLSTLGSGMLGLTLGCARCHDHKYDAIPTRDYYRLLAAVQSGERADVLLGSPNEIAEYEAAYERWQQQLKEVETKFADWLAAERGALDEVLRGEKIAELPISDEEKKLLRDEPESSAARQLAKKHAKALAIKDQDLKRLMSNSQRRQFDELQAAVKKAERQEPVSPPRAYAFREVSAEPKPTWLFRRADFYDKSQPVELGFLSVLTSDKPAESYWAEARAQRLVESSTYQRAALARWLTDTEQGAGALLARVIVNRIWQHHFGEGLVRTVSDFGVQGERPSHPELLQWLADDFVRHGWQIKRLHRQIMLSSVYLQDSRFDPAKAKVDPENRLLWWHRPLRLEAEILRDAMLAAAGTLNRQLYGPAFKPPIAAEAMVARNLKTPYEPEPADSPGIRRRSVYMFHKRVVPDPLLTAFDRPDSLQSCGRRDTTTVAPQALALVNDPLVRDCAVDFAERLQQEAVGDDAAAVRLAFALAFSRPPRGEELTAACDFLAQQRQSRQSRDEKPSTADAARAALADLCQALFGLNEFIYVD